MLALALVGACSTETERQPASPSESASAPQTGTDHWRPSVHFTPTENWMNDPNGLVFHEGLYHLFFQYNPEGSDWGNISWGHATSTDLVHWDEQPVAIEATAEEMVFSGSIVVDTENTSGLGTVEDPALVALYTSAYGEGAVKEPGVQAQSLAYSLDDGQTWQRYENNPVLTLDPDSENFRDPKVFWYEEGGYWVMATVVADAQVVKLYRSDDLIAWSWLSDFSGVGAGADDPGILWEMPDLFPLTADDGSEHWVLLLSINPGGPAGGSGSQYFVGDFDGTSFVSDAPAPEGEVDALWLDYGADFYAATTISGAPDDALIIGWMSNWDYAGAVPTSPWRGGMALPRRLTLLARDDAAPRLASSIAPAARTAIERSSTSSTTDDLTVDGEIAPLPTEPCAPVQLIDVRLEPGGAQRAGFVVHGSADGDRGARIVYDADVGALSVDRTEAGTAVTPGFAGVHSAPVELRDGALDLTVLVDRGSVEVYADGGRVAITDLVLPAEGDACTSVFAEGGAATFASMTVSTR
ncbi:glycoside hydrolase family 32 protein [Sanguibacter sp. 25GB23B1]|uniref:glycoside hydrolase family 32 protein n=1 Tax=unclassified Sanguibacter TaxID=2645534 RepID=UPI0032AF4F30